MKVFRHYIIVYLVLIVLTMSGLSYADNSDRRPLLEKVERSFEKDTVSLENHSLTAYLKYSALNNNALKASFYNWKSKLSSVAINSSLPEPQLTYGYFMENVETRVGPQRHKFGIKQMFPWFGTLGANKNIAYQNAEIAYQRFQSDKLNLYYKVKSAYYDFYLLGRYINITTAVKDLLTGWEKILSAKYETSGASYADLLKLQIELAKLDNQLLTYEQQKTYAQAKLKAVLNLPDSVSLPIPESLVNEDLEYDRIEILNEINANNPAVKARLADIEKEKQELSLAGKRSYPNFALGVNYIETGPALDPAMTESGKDPWEINLSLDLPLWFGKNKAYKNKARASLNQAQYNYRDYINTVAVELDKLLYEYNDASRQEKLYRTGLLPVASQALAIAYTAYENGEDSFLGVLDSQREWLKLNLEQENYLVQKLAKQAELEKLLGYQY